MASITCKKCKYWKSDIKYNGLGSCQNEKVMDMFILGHVDMFLLSEDFGCIFFELKIRERTEKEKRAWEKVCKNNDERIAEIAAMSKL
jgi:peptide subunit release factor 1 (eRF1)